MKKTTKKVRHNLRALVARRVVALAGCCVVLLVNLVTTAFLHPAFGPLDGCGGIREAQIEIKQLSNMVETHYLMSSPRELPERLGDLASGENKLTEMVPKDPWGNGYIYIPLDDRDFLIFSAGPDGIAGNEDDVFEKGSR